MRLFIAIPLPPQAQQTLAEVALNLARQAKGCRPVPPGNFHLTLVFIGETTRIQEVKDTVEKTVRQTLATLPLTGSTGKNALQLALQGIGSFKSGSKSAKGYTWWVGVKPSAALEGVAVLATALAAELRQAGFDIERRSFKPHITLARGVVTQHPIALEIPPLVIDASQIVLFTSQLGGEYPEYRQLATFPLHAAQ